MRSRSSIARCSAIEVKGIDNLAKAGPNLIIALNHVSFLDAGLALSLRDRKPVFAIDSAIAKLWWVRPFLKLTRAMPLDPLKPMAMRTLINAVKAGNALIIFPEGRITVTGSLMKVYDGAALIADKSDAEIVPVRIEGLEQTPFTRLKHEPGAPALVPQGDGDDARAGEAHRRPRAQGPQAPAGRGRRALRDHVRSRVPHHLDRPHRGRGGDRKPPTIHGRGRVAIEDPVTGALTYKRLLVGAAILGAKLMPLAARGARHRRHAAERQWRRGHSSGPDVGGPRAGHDQFHRRRGQHPRRLQGRADRHHPHLARLHREGRGSPT